jgi:hypothetical protein
MVFAVPKEVARAKAIEKVTVEILICLAAFGAAETTLAWRPLAVRDGILGCHYVVEWKMEVLRTSNGLGRIWIEVQKGIGLEKTVEVPVERCLLSIGR